jgi:antitoxin VapB
MSNNEKEVVVINVGNRRIISPSIIGWDEWFESGNVTDDFMIERNQPDIQSRESLDN